jgi:DNA (cytosine-5)-methyltransferase 1
LGVPQRRKRQLIIGVRNDVSGYFSSQIDPAPRATPRITLGPAISDLPILRAGGGSEEAPYDVNRRSVSTAKYGRAATSYLNDVLEVQKCSLLLNHRARPHNERDLRDFDLLREGESSQAAMRRGVEFEFPYDKESFKDRYTRQSRTKSCSTIVAHLSKDGLMFIHPTQRRSITPREAARIQSFPDWFHFPAARSHSFRLIGNAVPPLVSEAIGRAIVKFLSERPRVSQTVKQMMAPNRAQREPSISLASAVELKGADLRRLAPLDFLGIWRSVFREFPELHPCNAIDHGEEPERLCADGKSSLGSLFAVRYSRTGWPVALSAIGSEGWRRYRNGTISEDQMFLRC